MFIFVVFFEELRIWVGKKLIPRKWLSICFTVSFVLEKHIENIRSNHSEVFFWSAFLESWQILKRTCEEVRFLVKVKVKSFY